MSERPPPIEATCTRCTRPFRATFYWSEGKKWRQRRQCYKCTLIGRSLRGSLRLQNYLTIKRKLLRIDKLIHQLLEDIKQ